jgi:hypothetical protein
MKAKLLLVLSLFVISFSSTLVFASCGSCGPCGSSSSCGNNYYSCSDCSCDCTDYGYRWNNCMTKEEYCEAFGNVGATDDSGCGSRW